MPVKLIAHSRMMSDGGLDVLLLCCVPRELGKEHNTHTHSEHRRTREALTVVDRHGWKSKLIWLAYGNGAACICDVIPFMEGLVAVWYIVVTMLYIHNECIFV